MVHGIRVRKPLPEPKTLKALPVVVKAAAAAAATAAAGGAPRISSEASVTLHSSSRNRISGTSASTPVTVLEPGELPSMASLGFTSCGRETNQVQGHFSAHATLTKMHRGSLKGRPDQMLGGEQEALRRLRGLLSSSSTHQQAKKKSALYQHGGSQCRSDGSGPSLESVVGPGAGAFSCQISPWLSAGCLSPRLVYQEVLRMCGRQGKGETALLKGKGKDAESSWVVFELMWRDFFRLMAERHSQLEVGKSERGMALGQGKQHQGLLAAQ
jgi:hypothetical protein